MVSTQVINNLRRGLRKLVQVFGLTPANGARSWLEAYLAEIAIIKAGGNVWRVYIYLAIIIFSSISVVVSYELVTFDPEIADVLFPIVFHGRLTRGVYHQLLGMFFMTSGFYYVTYFQFHRQPLIDLLQRVLLQPQAGQFFLLGEKTIEVFSKSRTRITTILCSGRQVMLLASGKICFFIFYFIYTFIIYFSSNL